MRKIAFTFILLAAFALSTWAQFSDPFTVDVQVLDNEVQLDVDIPENHYIYADHFEVADALGNLQDALELPETGSIEDPETGNPKPVYDQSFNAVYSWHPADGGAGIVHVKYQGCNDETCFLPQDKEIVIDPAAVAEKPTEKVEPETETDWQLALRKFAVKESAVGYLGASDFITFLDRAETGISPTDPSIFHLFLADPVAFVREKGLVVTILFILIGGLALNLTPCVLPMVPVNLAIIWAGAQAGSKGRGFALGSVYGLGIALVYGLLGVIVVLTGSAFGTIQANPWFNLVIALIFVVLALAMFDVIHIDFSRFQSKLGSGEKKSGSFLLAISMGSVAALLAGACVAPVVIAVLLLATNIYEANSIAGLLLPFVLGIGMALPWPFAGAGLSFLPKPGKWMVYIKYGFALGIIFFALYYGHLSYQAFHSVEISDMQGEGHLVIDGSTNEGFADALLDAKKQGKPVFIDFWASSCKNCKAMDRTTFKDEMVRSRMEDYVFIKYIANELEGSPSTKAVMEYFDVQGLPTFVVLNGSE